MKDPLELLLVETEGIYLVQAGTGEPATWLGALDEARTEAERQAMALNKTVYIFRAVAKVEPVDAPTRWTELASHGPAQN